MKLIESCETSLKKYSSGIKYRAYQSKLMVDEFEEFCKNKIPIENHNISKMENISIDIHFVFLKYRLHDLAHHFKK